MPELKFSLVENAIDYIFEAIGCLNSKDHRKLKYAVLHLSGAVELVFKARLIQEHWSLVFNNPGNATRTQFEAGDFSSVDFQEVQNRLANVCNVNLLPQQPVLRALRKLRNRVEHFAFSAEIREIESLLIKIWSFLWDFLHKELPDEIADQQEVLDKVRDAMHKHQGLVNSRLKDLEPRVDALRRAGTTILTCPLCLQEALSIPGDDEPLCLFCHYQRSADQVADDWATVFVGYPHTDPKEASLYPVLKECPVCGSETMIEFEDGSQFPPDPAWACFTCGASGAPTSQCVSCGEEFLFEDPDVVRCPNCRKEGLPET
jgi:hypothetical protein